MICSISFLIGVGTPQEITRQFHLRTLKISGATSIFMSPLTLTWHAKRQPRRV